MLEFILHNGLWVTLALFAVGAIGALLFQKSARLANWWGHGLALLASASGFLYSAVMLLSRSSYIYKFTTAFPMLDISLRVDPFAAFFMLVTSGIALAASLYGIGYVAHYYGKYNLGAFGFFYNTFIASMLLVFSAEHALYFLIVWELMSLASYMLVLFEHREEGSVQAGFIYFVMTHVATAFIAFAFLLLYRATGSLDFSAFRVATPQLPLVTQTVVLLAALIGFGTKAGIIPFHIWLPKAHPAAPAHVSALMSGVMIKTGIFMLMKMFFDIVPSSSLWPGITLLLIGAVSSLLGVLYALSEHDLKRLLAYHSIENIGIILLGLGSALLFSGLGMRGLLLFALVAALYHTMNHAVFKALLFFGAGSVAAATHTRNIEEYGGLIKKMPSTALYFLIGSMAISALPPFNGFVSEWLTFQSMFAGLGGMSLGIKAVFVAGIASLAFTGGLAAACFVKAFGVTFLAKPRSVHAEHAHESGLSMRVAMCALALVALTLGIFARSVVPTLTYVAADIAHTNSAEAIVAQVPRTLGGTMGSLSMPALAGALFALLFAVALVVYVVTARRKVSRGLTWDCGAPLTARTEITATGFARSLITIFKGIMRPTKQIDVEYNDANMRYFPSSRSVELHLRDIYQAYLYGPVAALAETFSGWAKKIQSGNVHAYILYIGVTLAIIFTMLSWNIF